MNNNAGAGGGPQEVEGQVNNIQTRTWARRQLQTWVAETKPNSGGVPFGWYFFMKTDDMESPAAYGPYKTIKRALEVQRCFLELVNATRPLL